MKTISVLALVAGLLTAAPAFAATPGSDGLCGPDAPDAYKRPGGYCDTLDHGSLSLPTTGRSAEVPQDGEPPDVVVVSGCELSADGGFGLC
jgi:hypothetical protein